MLGMTFRVLNSNIASLQAQRNLTQATNTLGKAFERLSSGLRINRASDDAAGLSVSSLLAVDSRVFSRGILNINDGISLLQITDSAYDALSSIATRIAELSEQAANGVMSTEQRRSLDAEARALTAEYNRITNTVEFNGLKPLTGGASNASIQAGYGTSGSIALNISALIGANKADGTFQASVSHSIGNAVYDSLSGDFNGDGFDDIVSFADSVGITLSSSTGTYSPAGIAGSQAALGGTLGDFNGDGNLDIAWYSANNSDLRVSLGAGDGTFSSNTTFTVGGGVGAGRYLTAFDWNSDGRSEIFIADNSANLVRIYVANSDGSFQAPQTLAMPGSAATIVSGDINADGRADLIVHETTTDTVRAYLNSGAGGFSAQAGVTVANNFSNDAKDIEIADFDRDGFLDIAIAATYDSMQILKGHGDGTFDTAVNFSPLASTYTGGGLAAADFNGDGLIDLAYTNLTGGFADGILFGTGDGSFLSGGVTGEFGENGDLLIVDMNQDGVGDLVGAGGGEIFISLSNVSATALLPESNLLTQEDARTSLDNANELIQSLARERAKLGATLSRLSTASSNAQVTVTQYEQSRSQIVDADMAEEAARLVRTQILQQAASSVLAQANQIPALALRLLR
jgi:flagellin